MAIVAKPMLAVPTTTTTEPYYAPGPPVALTSELGSIPVETIGIAVGVGGVVFIVGIIAIIIIAIKYRKKRLSPVNNKVSSMTRQNFEERQEKVRTAPLRKKKLPRNEVEEIEQQVQTEVQQVVHPPYFGNYPANPDGSYPQPEQPYGCYGQYPLGMDPSMMQQQQYQHQQLANQH